MEEKENMNERKFFIFTSHDIPAIPPVPAAQSACLLTLADIFRHDTAVGRFCEWERTKGELAGQQNGR